MLGGITLTIGIITLGGLGIAFAVGSVISSSILYGAGSIAIGGISTLTISLIAKHILNKKIYTPHPKKTNPENLIETLEIPKKQKEIKIRKKFKHFLDKKNFKTELNAAILKFGNKNLTKTLDVKIKKRIQEEQDKEKFNQCEYKVSCGSIVNKLYLGVMYKNGIGTKKNINKATTIYKEVSSKCRELWGIYTAHSHFTWTQENKDSLTSEETKYILKHLEKEISQEKIYQIFNQSRLQNVMERKQNSPNKKINYRKNDTSFKKYLKQQKYLEKLISIATTINKQIRGEFFKELLKKLKDLKNLKRLNEVEKLKNQEKVKNLPLFKVFNKLRKSLKKDGRFLFVPLLPGTIAGSMQQKASITKKNNIILTLGINRILKIQFNNQKNTISFKMKNKGFLPYNKFVNIRIYELEKLHFACMTALFKGKHFKYNSK